MLAEGLKPAIRNDMIWMEPELCEPFSRDVCIFDWNYYGHRPESVAFFKEQGFSGILVCPSDNSWEGVINRQRLCPHLKARTDWPVKPDEIEAFLDDAAQQPVYSGFLTHWDNTAGRCMWPQWSAFARAALYMNGELDPGAECDEAIEQKLFGRITPYTEVTHLLQNDIQRSDLSQHFQNMLHIPGQDLQGCIVLFDHFFKNLLFAATVLQAIDDKRSSFIAAKHTT